MAENGCSLEDCYTNLFALTDLSGIKWCRLSLRPQQAYYPDPLDDPILVAFSKCIQADVLCAWRRQSCGSNMRPVEQLAGPKELWTFWYGDEPAILQSILENQVFETEQGSWDNGLSYECRTLLFKALHNLIERCLLSQNYIRVGKWFVQPHRDSADRRSRSAHLSMSFLFFLHGESTVCASVDVRQHPPLHCLRPLHMNVVSHLRQNGVQVLLAPYGLSGLLTGRSYSDSDLRIQRLQEDWRKYFCVPPPVDCSGEDGNHLPTFVEVIVGGMRLRYPSTFVLLPGELDAELTRLHGSMFPQSSTNGGVSEPESVPIKQANSGAETPRVERPIRLDCSFGDKSVSARVIEKSWQDGSVTTGMFLHGNRHVVMESDGRDETATTAPSVTSWEFGEPMHKNACFCAKNKGLKMRPTSTVLSKQTVGQSSGPLKHGKLVNERPEKLSRHSRSFAPYHRRTACARDPVAGSFPADARNPLDMLSARTLKPMGGHSAALGIQSHGSAPADSPHSAAPSPLTATQTQQPPVNPVADPTMPTLSPHPPPKPVVGGGEREARDTLSGLLNSNSGDSDPSAVVTVNVRLPLTSTAAAAESTYKDRVVMYSESAELLPQLKCPRKEPKKPVLSATFEGDDEEELVTSSFYDNSLETTFDAVACSSRSHRLNSEMSPSFPVSPPPSTGMPVRSMPADDPYQFSDENDSGVISGQLKMRDMRSASREDAFLKPSPFSSSRLDESGRREVNCNGVDYQTSMDMSPSPVAKVVQSTTLMHENDLKPNIQDLDNIFDTDEDGESDSPPSSMQHDRHSDDSATVARSVTSFGVPSGLANPALQGPSARDLSRMFPTPPSAEAACSISSPMQTSETMTVDTTTLDVLHHHLHHIHHHQSMTTHANVREESSITTTAIAALLNECPYVMVDPPFCQFPSSKMYDPVELPSSKLPPLAVADRVYRPNRGSNNMVPTSTIERHMVPIMPPHYSPFMDAQTGGNRFRRTDSNMSIDASPAMQHMGTGGPLSAQQRTPMNYEMMSPASSSGASSSFYAGRNMGSVEAPCHSVPTGPLPEASALFVSLALSDSPLSVFRDENFDSCTICVCNMSIDGLDVGSVLPARHGAVGVEDQIRCTCAFSAVINRRRAYLSGLFYEDEVDITGIRHSGYDVRKPPLTAPPGGWGDSRGVPGGNMPVVSEVLPDTVLQLLRLQMSSLYPSCAVARVCSAPRIPMTQENVHALEFIDGREACVAALEFGRQIDGSSCQPFRSEDLGNCLHPWPFYKYMAKLALNSTDVVQLLKSLQPLLQDAIQKKRSTRLWESVYTISGPLTWKDFHLMAGRGSEETSEPKPVPSMLVGYEQEWLSISPHSIRYWEMLLLEPCFQPHDILYVVVAPENDYILGQSSVFFQQLSVMYEQCRLGRHRPISDKLRDGVMRVGRTNSHKVTDEPVDEWFNNIGNTAVASKLKLYAQVCKKLLAPFLTHCLTEKKRASDESIGRPSSSYQPYRQLQNMSDASDSIMSSTASSTVPVEVTSTFDGERNVTSDMPDGSTTHTQSKDYPNQDSEKEHMENVGSNEGGIGSGDGPFLVVYMVDSFTYGLQEAEIDDPNASRLAMIGLLQCFIGMLKAVPENLHNAIQLQIVPQQTLTDFVQFGKASQFLKSLSFSVYANCRRSLARAPTLSRSLTGFGPASSAEKMWHSNSTNDPGTLYSPPYVLAPPREFVTQSLLDPVDRSTVLLCSYCLSSDQHWLLASCTDSRGEFVETTCINVDIPLRSRRRYITVRRLALQKLWDFLLGVMAQTTTPWRVVIGRFGRLGHGELKGWSAILSRRNLRACNEKLHAACSTCRMLGSDTAVPCVISACVVSTELHPSIHIMADAVKPDDNQKTRRPLSTPNDASCTHILVFPTSATAQANVPMNPQETHIEHDFGNVGELKLFGDGDNIDDDIGGDLGDLGDLFGVYGGSPKMHTDLTGSPVHHADHGRHSLGLGGGGGGRDPTTAELLGADTEDQSNHALLQQPLAVGFFVSTAPTGPIPSWFWSSCPQRENLCPVCFRAALHIHCPFAQQKEELMHNSVHSNRVHPLDSNLTCDVLRYVLETYNSLSWLTIDPTTGDRRSCLPAHILILLQLCRGFETFV